MKVGIVGVGRWGRILAGKFALAGAEIAAHDRHSDLAMPDRFGPRVPWKDMLDDPGIDAVVCAADPDTTSHLMMLAQGKKACFLTKPILVERVPDVLSVTYVDYIHLASNLYQMIWKEVARRGIQNVTKISVVSIGCGPERAFPGVLDYGPHAMAMLVDMTSEAPGADLMNVRSTTVGTRESIHMELTLGTTYASVTTGNALDVKETSITLTFDDGKTLRYCQGDDGVAYAEVDGKIVAKDANPDPLKDLVSQFLIDATAGEPHPYFLNLSAIGTEILMAARKEAGLPRLGSSVGP